MRIMDKFLLVAMFIIAFGFVIVEYKFEEMKSELVRIDSVVFDSARCPGED